MASPRATALSIGVMGAGAIGCYVGGRLAARGEEVMFIGRAKMKEELAASGLHLTGMKNEGATVDLAPDRFRFETDPSALAKCDIVLVCVKSAQSEEAGKSLAPHVSKDAFVVSLQNGVGNADALRRVMPEHRVLGGIVGFNVLSRDGGVFRRATTGPLAIEWVDDPKIASLARALEESGFETELTKDIRGKQWSKLVMNLNNAVSALSGAPTPVLLYTPGYRRVLRAVMKEALGVLDRAGIAPARLGPLPPRAFPWLLSLPTPILKVASRAQLDIDPEARSSMWEDLTRHKKTEVDYLNGEIVRLAEKHGGRAPLNERIVALVHDAEAKDAGSPELSPESLWRALTT